MDVLWRENNIFYHILCVLITENEKLFDRSDARLYWKTVTHMMGLFHHAYIANYAFGLNLNSEQIEIKTLKTFRAGYLTGWNFTFQTTFLSLALLHDALEWVDKHESKFGKRIRYFRDVVFSGLVWPFTFFVTSMFWCVYAIDRELVFPQVYDAIVPWWFNHCVHTNIMIVILLETLLQSRRHPADLKIETILYVTVSVLYAIVYYSIYFFAHRWLYGVFGVMTWWQVCLYQIMIWISSHVFYKMQFPINRIFHKAEELEEKQQPNEIQKVEADGKIVNRDHDVNGESKGVLNGMNGRSDGAGIDTVSVKSNEKESNGLNPDWKRLNENSNRVESNEKREFKIGGYTKPNFDKSWSMKYRTIRNQFENSSL